MNKLKYCALTLVLFLMCLNNVQATCTNQEIEDFKKIEEQYKITYELNEKNKTYNVYLNKTNSDKYDYSIPKEFKCKKEDTITKCENIQPGTYNIQIIGKTETCNKNLKNIILELEKYNEFYGDPLCEGIEEFVLCQKTYDKEIEYETFKSRVETYKKTKNQKEENNKTNLREEFFEKTTTFLEENLMKIIIIVITTTMLIIAIIAITRRIRKRRRLE